MKPLLRYSLIALSILVLLIGLLLAYLAWIFDPNAFKTQLAQMVQDKYHRSLRIDGNIGLRFFPKIGVDLEKISLSEASSAQEFARLGQARVSLAVLPLLSKQIVIDKIAISDVDVHVRRSADGSTNFDDLLGKPSREETGSKDETAQTADKKNLRLNVEGIQISNANLHIDDQKAQIKGALKSFSLTTGALGSNSKSPIELNAQLQFQQPQLDAQLELKSQLEMRMSEQLLLLQNLQAKLDLKLTQDRLSLDFNSAKLGMQGQQLVHENSKLEAKLNGSQQVLATLTGGKLDSSAVPWKLDQLQLTVEQNKDAIKRQFILNSSASWASDTQELTLPQLQAQIKIKDPKLMQQEILVPLSGHLSFNLSQKNLQTRLHTQFDESKADLKLAVKADAQPMIDLDLGVDQFNLDRYVKHEKADAAKPESDADQKPLDLKWLDKLLMRGELRLQGLQAKNLKLNNIVIPIAAANGTLSITQMQAQLYQGSLNGNLKINSNNHLTVDQALNNIDINGLLKDFLQKDVLEGRGTVKLAMNTQGKYSSEFKKNLNGNLSVKLNDGAVKGINLAKSLRDFKAKITGKSDQQQAANAKEKTDFTAMSMSVQFKEGIGSSNDLEMKSPFLRVGGSGQIDLPASKIDYTAKVMVVNTATGQEGTELAQLKDISIPVRLSGPFDHLDYHILFSQIGSDALKAAFKAKAAPVLEEKKQELKQKVDEQLKDRLKNLLSR